jgi:ABC-type multidrug transport system permease subunit
MNAFVIARHHLVRIVRSPGLIVILLAIPVTLATLEYAAFGPTVASGKLPPIKVLILDQDNTFLSRAVPQVFTTGGPLKDMFETSAVTDRAAAKNLFLRNEASALLIVPAGFQNALLTGGTGELQFAPNPLQTFSPQIARSVLEMSAVIGNGLYQQAIAPIQRINALRSSGREPTSDEVAEISRGFFDAGKRLNGLRAATSVKVTTVRPSGEREARGTSPRMFFAFIFPGLVIFGVMFISQSLALRLLRDRVRGLERRVRMTPATSSSQLAGSFLFMMGGLAAVLVLLILVGALLFRIELRNPGALIVLAGGIAVFAAAFQLAIVGIAASERTASFISSGLIMLLSLLGGTFVPAEDFPAFLRRIAYATPNGAAQQGFIDVLAHGQSLGQASARILTIWIWALLTASIAMFVAQRSARRA